MIHRKRSNTVFVIMIVLAAAALSACSGKQDSTFTVPSVSLSTDQIAKYEASCMACHALEGTGAPVRGDAKAWAAILKQPIEAVMDRVINGYQGMPPLGQCFDCDEKDLESLVYYLGTPKDQSTN